MSDGKCPEHRAHILLYVRSESCPSKCGPTARAQILYVQCVQGADVARRHRVRKRLYRAPSFQLLCVSHFGFVKPKSLSQMCEKTSHVTCILAFPLLDFQLEPVAGSTVSKPSSVRPCQGVSYEAVAPTNRNSAECCDSHASKW